MRYELSKTSGQKPWKVTVTDNSGQEKAHSYGDRKAAENALRQLRAKRKEG